MFTFMRCLCAMAVVWAAGCVADPLSDDYWPTLTPLGDDIESVRVPASADGDRNNAPHQPVPHPTGELTLQQSLALALQHNPALAGFAWEIRAAEARMLQAGLWPNPEFDVEIENFGGTGPASDFDSGEVTLAIGQTIPLAGKINKQWTMAQHQRDLAGWAYESARVAVYGQTAHDFIAVLTAQQRVEIERETTALAEQIYDSIAGRVEAGRVSPVEQTKANVELAEARLELQRAERALTSARYQLAANWGSASPAYAAVAGDLESIEPPPGYDTVVTLVDNNPDLARWSSEMALRRAAIELAMAEAVPDLTVLGGVRVLDGGDDTAFVVGASVPIPLFDRNQGGIWEARVNEQASQAMYDAAAVRVRTDLALAIEHLRSAYEDVVALHDEILPGSRSAFDAADEAFRQGKIGGLDLLDAERTLFDARGRYVDALGEYHRAVVTAERLIGAPLPSNTPSQKTHWR